MTLSSLLVGRSVAVVLGDGGVGKTTVAAALALDAASNGRRVLAVTVDPSNRLRDALSLSGSAGLEERVEVQIRGSLHAMVLDAQTELDRVVARMLPDAERRRRVTESLFYRKAASMTGTHEYLAMDRVLEAKDSGRYDLIVLDTPPERHSIDFLDAPRRIDALLGHEGLRVFMSASAGLSRAGLATLRLRRLVLKGIGLFAGEETFLKLLEFILAFAPVYDEYRGRAARARAMLTGPDCAAFVVCRPSPRCAEHVRMTLDALRQIGVLPAAVVVNQVMVWPPPGCSGRGEVDAGTIKDALMGNPAVSLYSRQELSELADVTLRLAAIYRKRAEADNLVLASIRDAACGTPVFVLPALRDDIHDLKGLSTFAQMVRVSRVL